MNSALLKAAIERRAAHIEAESERHAKKAQQLDGEAMRIAQTSGKYLQRSRLEGRQVARLNRLLANWDKMPSTTREAEISLTMRYLHVNWDYLLEAGEKNCYDCENNEYCNRKGIGFGDDGCIFIWECEEVEATLDKCNADIIDMLTSEEPKTIETVLYDIDEVTDAIPSLELDQEALQADWDLCKGCRVSEQCDGLHSNICPHNALYQRARISAEHIIEVAQRLF